MKKILLLLVFSIIVSCNKDDVDYVTVKGRVEREISGEGISGQKVTLRVYQHNGSGAWSYSTEIDSKEVTTDSNGNFSAVMKTDSNPFVSVYKPQDDNFTAFELTNFFIDRDIVMKVNKFIKFKIFVNNTNPFDANDFVNIDFHSGFHQNFRTNIQNFGAQNIQHPAENLPGGGSVGAWEEASWNGTNVNSIVYYNVPENGDQFKVVWRKRKNGIETTGFTPNIPYQLNQVNEFHFDY